MRMSVHARAGESGDSCILPVLHVNEQIILRAGGNACAPATASEKFTLGEASALSAAFDFQCSPTWMSRSSVVLLSSLCGSVGDASLKNAKRGGYRAWDQLRTIECRIHLFVA
ncbi:unnamed protein product [Bathycoccus prasinos]